MTEFEIIESHEGKHWTYGRIVNGLWLWYDTGVQVTEDDARFLAAEATESRGVTFVPMLVEQQRVVKIRTADRERLDGKINP